MFENLMALISIFALIATFTCLVVLAAILNEFRKFVRKVRRFTNTF